VGHATITHDEENRSWRINCLYYGLTDELGRPLHSASGTARTPITGVRARWAIESLSPNTAAAAHEIVALEEAITDLVLAHRAEQATAAKPYAGLESMIWGRATADQRRFPEARLTARKEGGVWHIADFDFHAWTATIPAPG
jgi:hypothetical protein